MDKRVKDLINTLQTSNDRNALDTMTKVVSGLRILFFCISLLLLSTCSPQPKYRTSSFGYSTNNPEALQPFLFNPEDLDDGWFADTYEESTQGLLPPGEDNPFIDRIEVRIAAESLPPPNRMGIPSRTPYWASQLIWAYPDEDIATIAFFDKTYYYGELPPNVDFQPRLINFATGCVQWSDTLRCYFTGQHGRYISEASMPIDGELITLQDWEDLLNTVQDRLVDYVE